MEPTFIEFRELGKFDKITKAWIGVDLRNVSVACVFQVLC